MVYSTDMKWRAVTLVQFQQDGNVDARTRERRPSYPADVVNFIADYVGRHPCFFVEELQDELVRRFATRRLPFSHATILRVLRFELNLSRKVLERRAREALPDEVTAFAAKLRSFYSYPEQLVFADETAKKAIDSMRNFMMLR
ncbi:hypothetical protein PINS_up013066 [Pythium insidiosum]|nr:hypothetical protein PINS_up013066 [Pythium insidiosum]